jgi:hypothetical protein
MACERAKWRHNSRVLGKWQLFGHPHFSQHIAGTLHKSTPQHLRISLTTQFIIKRLENAQGILEEQTK